MGKQIRQHRIHTTNRVAVCNKFLRIQKMKRCERENLGFFSQIILFYFMMASMVFPSPICLASKMDVINSSTKVIQKPVSSFTISGTHTINKSYKRDQSPLQRLSPKDAVILMNSIDFLQELVKVKDTTNEKYYGINLDQGENQSQLQGYSDDVGIDRGDGLISVVEYTGRLWFLNKLGVQFQESVQINKLSECGKYATIECVTKYKRKNKWVDCSKVICSFLKSDEHNDDNDDHQGLSMKVVSEVLVQLPLLGAGRAVKKQITKTFEAATDSFFHRLEATRNF